MSRLVLGLLLAAALLLAAGTGVGWLQARGTVDELRQAEELRVSAEESARTFAVDLTSYDHTSLEQQQATLAAESTERFQESFADSMKTLGPLFSELEASAAGEVLDTAVRSVSETAAVVLVFVDQEAASNKTDEPQTQGSRLRLHLVREDGGWLLDQVDLV